MYLGFLIIATILFAGVVTYFMRHPAASMYHPATWYLAFHGLVFVIRPWFGWYYEYHNMYQKIEFTPTISDKCTVIAASSLGMIVFVLVSLSISKRLNFVQGETDILERDRLLVLFIPIAILLSIASINSFIWYWDMRSTAAQFMQFDTRTGGTALVGANGYFISLVSMMTPIVAMLVWLGRYRMWTWAPFIAFGIFKLGTGGRGDFIAAGIMLAMLYLYDKRRAWPEALVIVGIVASAFIFNAIGTDRGAGLRELVGFENEEVQTLDRDAEAPLETMDLASMEFFEYIVYVVPQRSGTYDYFLNNLQLFTEPIPRSWWPNKPIGAPIVRFELYKWGRTIGATMSLPGAGWFSFGYVGVVIWSAFFAMIYGGGYWLFARSKQSNIAVMAYMIFVATSVISFRDGSLVTIFKQCLFYYLPVVILALVAKVMGGLDSIAPPDGALAERNRQKAEYLAAGTPRNRRLAAVRIEEENRRQPPEPDDGDTPQARRRARMAQG